MVESNPILNLIDKHFRSTTKHVKKIIVLVSIESRRSSLEWVTWKNNTAIGVHISLPVGKTPC